MSKTGKRIPIKSAKDIAENYGYSQVIITAWDKTRNRYCVTTYGKTLEDCEQAAIGGNVIKKQIGYPDELCNTKPARIKRKEAKNP